MELRKYGADALFLFPLIDYGATDFLSGATSAAGDAKVRTDREPLANISAERLSFSSGSEEPAQGATIVGATSGATATVMFVIRTGGTWGGGNAAGFIFIKARSGTFQAEDINISGGSSNVLTIAAASVAGLFAALTNGYAVALTAAEMQCKTGQINIVDSATKEWEDQAIIFETYGNASAMHPFDLGTALQSVNLTQWKGATPASLVDTDKVPVSVQHWNVASITVNITGNITGNLLGSVDLAKLLDTNAIPAAALTDAAVAKIEAALLNEGDGQALIDAIVQAIDAADIENDVLPALVRDAILNRVLAGNHDNVGTVGKLLQDIFGDTDTAIPASIAALNDLDAAGVRAALGLASANLDTQLGDIPTVSELNARTLLASAYATQAKLLAYIQLLARGDAAIKADKATELGEINADEGGGAGGYDSATDSQESIRNASGGGSATNVSVRQQSASIKGSSS